jgi:hypothetical protein
MVTFQWLVNYRTIVFEHPAEAEIGRFADPDHRFHEQLRALEWLLCRTPEVGLPRQKSEPEAFLVHVVKGDDLAKTSDLWILYSYDADEVTVHAMRSLHE